MDQKSNMGNSLKVGMALVLSANLINLVISLLNGFVLPKYLSIEAYADIKTYQLFAGYIGIAVLGYSDGLYLSYGGKKISEIGCKDFTLCRTNLLCFQGVISVLILGLAVVLNNRVLLITAVSFIPVNIMGTYKCIFQATGEFKIYSKILNYTSILNFIGTMVLLLVFKTDNALLYISWMVLVTFIVWFLLELKIKMLYGCCLGFEVSTENLKTNIKSGFLLMLGNFSAILVSTIDRWFVKIFMTVEDFAYYSFAVSVQNLIEIFIIPVVTTMYNYICVTSDYKAIKKIKNMCMLFALILISSAFPVKFILEVYLTQYLPAKKILFILFSTEVLYMIIRGIYINIYKARKQQRMYFYQLVFIIILGCVLNAGLYFVFRTKEAIAFATLMSVICWYLICCSTVKEIRPDWKELLVLVVCLISFLLAGFFIPSILGFIVYILVVLIMSLLFMRTVLTTLLNSVIIKKVGS